MIEDPDSRARDAGIAWLLPVEWMKRRFIPRMSGNLLACVKHFDLVGVELYEWRRITLQTRNAVAQSSKNISHAAIAMFDF
jgi:hypothetical protein